MEQLLAYLNSVEPMSPALCDRLKSIVCIKTLAKHDFHLKAGQVNRDICFIKKGLLRCYYLKGEKEVSVWFLKEGDVTVSVKSFYKQVPSYEYIQALEPCELFHISYEQYRSVYKEFHDFCLIRGALMEKYMDLWADQLFTLRLHNGPERYQFLLGNEPELIQRVPDKYLASYLGIDKITLSRIKRKFSKGKGGSEK